MRAKVALFVCAALVTGLASARGAQAADAATEEARRHYLKGNQFFDVGRWDEAAEEYEKGYAIRNDPSFLYNMAQACRRKGDARRAIDLYKNYLMKAPKSPQRAEVEDRIRVLQKQVEDADAAARAGGPSSSLAPAPTTPASAAQPMPPPAQPAATGETRAAAPYPAYYPPASTAGAGPAYSPAAAPNSYGPPASSQAWPGYATPGTTATAYPAPSPYGTTAAGPGYYPQQPPPPYVQSPAVPAPTTQPGHGLRVAGVVCFVGGAAAAGAGIVFGALAKSYSDSVQSGAVFNPNFDERGKLYDNLQWVGYGVGAGLIATGAVLYGIGAVTGSRGRVALAPTALPSGAGISAGGTF